jgi:hypothetical protein
MNRINKFLPILFIAVFAFFASCENVMDIHKQFIEDGEVIYAPKPLEVQFKSGIGRVQLFCTLYNSPNVKTIDVFWNDKLDSLIIPVNPTVGQEIISEYISGLEEKAYTFIVRTTDVYGHHSLEISGYGTCFGPNFESTLSNRYVNDMALTPTQATLNWSPAYSEEMIWTQLRYKKANGDIGEIKVLPENNSTVCPDAERKMAFAEYRSVFIPVGSVDTIYGEWMQTQFPKASIYFYGAPTTAGWDANLAMEMPFNKDNPWVYVWEGRLTRNGNNQMKILTILGNSSGYQLRPLKADDPITETGMQIYSGGTDLKWILKSDSENGYYRMTADMNEMQIKFEKLSD